MVHKRARVNILVVAVAWLDFEYEKMGATRNIYIQMKTSSFSRHYCLQRVKGFAKIIKFYVPVFV